MTPPRLPTIVRASAGSGKTHRLTEEVIAAVAPSAREPVRLEGLVAVTYTRKAQAELAGRIRRALVEHGAYDQATRLPIAFLGTVHGVCLRLLQEFALDAGLSPYIEVLPDDHGRRLRAALESALDGPLIDRLDRLAAHLEIYFDGRTQRHNWIRPAVELMTLARSNRIAADALPAMGERSADGLLALLPAARGVAEELDHAFAVEAERARAALAAIGDETKASREVRRFLHDLGREPAIAAMPWSQWVKAAHAETGKRSRAAVVELQRAAERYQEHPRLHRDLRDFTTGIFEAARIALGGYATWKARRRVVDYVDMIDRALVLVEDDGVAAELRSRLELIVVDELQDTSPLQLALFTRLHQLAGRSVWVGDGKQCIFEYAGADPLLMDAVVTWAAQRGDAPERLSANHRSRPELVDACAEIFRRAFATHGVSGEDVRTCAARPMLAELAPTPPFAIWWLEATNLDGEAEAIACGVRRLLDAPALTPVLDRDTREVRALRPGDIGILVATNALAGKIASSLHRGGVRVAVARAGLMSTPEGALLDAALRWLIDPRDRLSLAVLEALDGWNGVGPDAWLTARLAARDEASAAPAWLTPVAAVREQLAVLGPAEVLDRVIYALDAPTRCARWPDAPQRLGNLEALRGSAAAYQERCARHREAASVAGLLRYFDETRRVALVDDEERALDDQLVPRDDDAVTVSTYHRAKGLEWPIVVLASLDRRERRDAFAPCPESERASFDPDDPLGGRWLRYWPWAFGRHTSVPLREQAAASAEGRRVAERERRERVRLLYVGFTRARDQLILAAQLNKRTPATAWLDELRDDEGGEALLTLPTEAADGALAAIAVCRRNAPPLELPCRVARLAALAPRARPHEAPWRFARPTATPIMEPAPFRITPSQREVEPGAPSELRVGAVRRIGPGLTLGRTDVSWESLGTTVHAFLAADGVIDDAEARLALARRLLAHGALTEALEPGALLAVGDALRAEVERRWPGARWDREAPITALVETPAGRRRIEGVLDLLLTLEDGVVVIDHKTFPVAHAGMLATRARDFAPQVAAYTRAVRALGGTVRASCLHFPLAGAWVDLLQ